MQSRGHPEKGNNQLRQPSQPSHFYQLQPCWAQGSDSCPGGLQKSQTQLRQLRHTKLAISIMSSACPSQSAPSPTFSTLTDLQGQQDACRFLLHAWKSAGFSHLLATVAENLKSQESLAQTAVLVLHLSRNAEASFILPCYTPKFTR